MSARELHAYRGGVRWRLVDAGIEIEGVGVERTPGEPVSAARVWERFGREVNAAARAHRVPAAILVATILTESSGRADAVRLEPGYVSDARTPDRVSVGLMQTLISTASGALGRAVGRAFLLVPAGSIGAGAAYIASQRTRTALDPPLVAAAYNAGGLYPQTSAGNRWRLRQYPIGTGEHCDRFVRWFNDAVAVLAGHPLRPAVGLEQIGTPSGAPAAPSGPVIRRGDRGPRVRALQQSLARAGVPCAVDGVFGPGTHEALRSFQRAAGLEVDGIAGPATWSALRRGLPAPVG